MIYLINDSTGKYADKACTGEHNVKPVDSIVDAKAFDDQNEAWEFSQNFGPDWRLDD